MNYVTASFSISDFRIPDSVLDAVFILKALRDTLGGLPHPDDRAVDVVRACTGEYLIPREHCTHYDKIMEGVFAQLGDLTYDIAMALNAEIFDRD